MRGRAAQRDPFAQAGRQALDALGHQEDVVAHQATQGDCVNGPIKLRQRVEHDALQARNAVSRPGSQVLQGRESSRAAAEPL